MWSEKVGTQLARPTRSVAGWLVSRFLLMYNELLEESTVQLCRIQPEDTVLELGHGPGNGLQSAAKRLTAPSGRLIGVDYSEYMHKFASEQIKDLVTSGKVTLLHCDVAAMPLPENSVDKVFHCNCYYYWPDLRKGATEIHRVMKPGGLMVTTLRISTLSVVAKYCIPGENWRPDNYMAALKDSGFTDVRMEDRKNKTFYFSGHLCHCIKMRLESN